MAAPSNRVVASASSALISFLKSHINTVAKYHEQEVFENFETAMQPCHLSNERPTGNTHKLFGYSSKFSPRGHREKTQRWPITDRPRGQNSHHVSSHELAQRHYGSKCALRLSDFTANTIRKMQFSPLPAEGGG
eukprot:scpid106480/ scgid14070/ 